MQLAEQLRALQDEAKGYLGDVDLSVLDRAFAFGRAAHDGQLRDSGEEYMTHPLAVAEILAELQLDLATLTAALLHDTVEDTDVTLEQLEAEFGEEVAALVDGVTKLGKLNFKSREEAHVENLRKMFLAMAQDLRVVLIKLADRLHNMRTLNFRPVEKQASTALETLEIFAPLAHRLGIAEMKWELEDRAFRYLEPEKYRELARLVAGKRAEREALTEGLIESLRERIEAIGVTADISGRAKHFYSIYKKMYRQGKDLSELYDLIAIRIIVDDVKDCYGVLGVIHSAWRPLPGRFKDYIATPKPNMYQSLHTTVIGPHGEPFEIQIRTWDMHRTAEFGVAAHWSYKEGKSDAAFDRKLGWLRSLLDWQMDAREFVESVKVDIFSDQVFVFSPKGDVFSLPAQATPLDFAFLVHTNVGYRCVGAKVNGRIMPLDSQLSNGDIVEVLTSKQSPGPSRDWLNIVKTSGARNKIRQWFKRERRDENLAKGKEAIEREVKRLGFEPHELMKPEWLEEVRRKHNLPSDEELYLMVGIGTLTSGPVVSRLRDLYERANRPGPDLTVLPGSEKRDWAGFGKPTSGVRVKGVDNLLISFSRCCSPVPGDPIIGFVSRGKGITIHRMDCPNMNDLSKEPDRLIEVAWDEGYSAAHPVELRVTALDRPGLLVDVASVVADAHIPMLSASAKGGKSRLATIKLVLEIKDVGQLQFLIQRIKRVKDVMTVDRPVREVAK